MSIIVNLLLFILILGIIVFIHEFGHFIFAKITGVYVYEFSIGMGPKLFSKKGKSGETDYSIRAIPIGGFCSLAGEDIENDDKSIPKNRKLQSKTKLQRFLIMFMGPGFNFLLAIVILLFIGLCFGSSDLTPRISSTQRDYPAYDAGLTKGDLIKEINGHKIYTMDDVTLYIALQDHKKDLKIKAVKKSGLSHVYTLKAKKEVSKVKGEKVTSYKYGIGLKTKKVYGVGNALKFTFVKTCALFRQMWVTVVYLFTGHIRLNQLSGPVGIYSIVGEQSHNGFSALIYLLAYLSINVGFLNLLPIPAFDGGHILFIIIELIKGSPVDPKLENKIHTIGLMLLMLLMLVITINDILRLF